LPSKLLAKPPNPFTMPDRLTPRLSAKPDAIRFAKFSLSENAGSSSRPST